MIYKISPHPSLPKRGRKRSKFIKDGERKSRNDPTISGDKIELNQLLEKIRKIGLEQEWKQAQKISEE